MNTPIHFWNRYQHLILLAVFTAVGAALAIVDHILSLDTMLVEGLHFLAVTAILIFCVLCDRKYPDIRQFGWRSMMLGVALLWIGSVADFFDNPPTLHLLTMPDGVPFGRSWEQAFLKKVVGYSVGIGLVAYGLAQWVPWMIDARHRVEQLNQSLSEKTNQLNRIRLSLEDHIESERLHISRELHDDVAQQLASFKIQTQIAQKLLSNSGTDLPELNQKLGQLGGDASEVLASVRRISHGLRPESLYELGLISALEQFLEKLRLEYPQVEMQIEHYCKRPEGDRLVNLPDAQSLEVKLADWALMHAFRVLQEGVRNALKHSGASKITVVVEDQPDHLVLKVLDNGKGLAWQGDMPTDAELIQGGHLGLVGMRERISSLKGTFQLVQQYPGTCLTVTLPVAVE